MLQRQAFQEQLADDDQGQFLTPSHVFDLVKRRWLRFTIPFLLLSITGGGVALLWPATYLAVGKILVESPQIPSDLVRPTVAILANERVQIIEQRIMTRDNLLAIARKFNLTTDWQGRLSGTELVDFIREHTEIKPLELKVANSGRAGNQAIAFTVGFEHEQPLIATRVANELMTMILSEDVRGRTASATETTRFLSEETKRLEGQIRSIDSQLGKLNREKASAGIETTTTLRSDDEKQLASLRAELLIRSATLSDEHPDIRALKRRIKSFEAKVAAVSAQATDGTSPTQPPPVGHNQSADTASLPSTSSAIAAAVDALTTQKTNLNTELTGVTQKLAAARLGENLERGQYAERLRVIEQPTLPDKPIHPNRPKIFAIAVAFALMASGGLVFAAETLNPAIRRAADLYSIIDSHLVVSIPYVTTLGETRRKKKRIIYTTGAFALIAVSGLIAVFFVLPPLDVLIAKITARLLG